jgi:hypothetical protein
MSPDFHQKDGTTKDDANIMYRQEGRKVKDSKLENILTFWNISIL